MLLASEPVQLALPFLLVPRSDRRVDTDQMRQLLIGRNVHAAPGRLACRAPPPTSGGLPRMIPASTSEISAPRRHDVAGFLFAGGNRLLSVSIDANAGGVIGQRLPIRSTGPTRFIGVPSRTAPRVTGSSRHWLDRSTTPGLTIQLAGG